MIFLIRCQCLKTVGCHYDVVQYIIILHTTLQMQQGEINQTLNDKTPQYLIRMGKVWGICCEHLGENWPHYNSITFYNLLWNFPAILSLHARLHPSPLTVHPKNYVPCLVVIMIYCGLIAADNTFILQKYSSRWCKLPVMPLKKVWSIWENGSHESTKDNNKNKTKQNKEH